MHFMKDEKTFVKISEENAPGWDNYTGQIGDVHFVDGYSTEPLDRHQIYRISSSINLLAAQRQEDGTFVTGDLVGALYEVGDATKETPSDYKSLPTLEEIGVDFTDVGDGVPATNSPAKHSYTREQLAQIADEQGIKGLREVAEPFGVKGKSVEQIIDGMMTLVGEESNEQNSLEEFEPNATSAETVVLGAE